MAVSQLGEVYQTASHARAKPFLAGPFCFLPITLASLCWSLAGSGSIGFKNRTDYAGAWEHAQCKRIDA
jgi:hypothetical protein